MPIRFWKNRTRLKTVGLFIHDGVLYAQRYADHPDYALRDSAAARRAYLAPVPVSLRNARVFFDSEVIEESPDPADREPFEPILPPRLAGKQVYRVSVSTEAGELYRAWSLSSRESLRLHRESLRLISSANAAAAEGSVR